MFSHWTPERVYQSWESGGPLKRKFRAVIIHAVGRISITVEGICQRKRHLISGGKPLTEEEIGHSRLAEYESVIHSLDSYHGTAQRWGSECTSKMPTGAPLAGQSPVRHYWEEFWERSLESWSGPFAIHHDQSEKAETSQNSAEPIATAL